MLSVAKSTITNEQPLNSTKLGSGNLHKLYGSYYCMNWNNTELVNPVYRLERGALFVESDLHVRNDQLFGQSTSGHTFYKSIVVKDNSPSRDSSVVRDIGYIKIPECLWETLVNDPGSYEKICRFNTVIVNEEADRVNLLLS